MTNGATGTAAMAVGFAGLGRMGWWMAANVARAGYPLWVQNRTRSRAEAFAAEHPVRGVCDTPGELARAVDVVVTMLADGPAVDDVYLGEGGLLSSVRPGCVLIEMSTIGPDHLAVLADKVVAAGVELVDAPVSGSVALAQTGRLLVMAGGEPAAIERVRPLLETIGSNVLHVGPSGAGATMKLVVNTVVYGLNQSVSEALVLAERAGLDRLLTYQVFVSSAIAAPFVQYRREAFERPGNVPVAFSIELASKDLELILDLGEDLGADLRQARTNLTVLDETAAAGLREEDVSAVARYLRDKNRAPPAGIPERGG